MTSPAPTPALPPRSLHPAVALGAGFVVFLGMAGSTWLNLAGWLGLAIAAALAAAISVVMLVAARPRVRPAFVPWFFVAFLAACLLGLIGAGDPGRSALGLAAQGVDVLGALALVLCLTWRELLRVLSAVTRLVVVASLLFELVVAVAVRHPVPALGLDDTWSRQLLLTGGPIQGVPGSAAALGAAALIGLIALSLEAAQGSTRPAAAAAWAVIFVATLLLADAGASLIAALAGAAVLIVAAAVRTVTTPRARAWLYLLLAAVTAAIVVGVVQAQTAVMPVPTGTGSLWTATGRAAGPIGVVLLAATLLGVLWRSWFLATDKVFSGARHARASAPATLLPLLLGVALVVRGSLMPVSAFQGGWLLLAAVVLGTALRRGTAEVPLPRRTHRGDAAGAPAL